MRQIVLDTETTGLEPSRGHRIIEIGCVELVDRKLTGKTYHQYVNPDREIDDAAIEVHGITNEFLQDKPRFEAIAEELVEFLTGAELVIHNAPFDVGFLDHELSREPAKYGVIADFCSVLDTLVLARQKHPGQKNSLDALCKRYGIDNSHRDLHGALLDAEILADVYLAMTGGQTLLSLSGDEQSNQQNQDKSFTIRSDRPQLKVIQASDEERAAHLEILQQIDDVSGDGCLWLETP